MLILIFGFEDGLGDDFGQSDIKAVISHRFLAKCLFETALPWQKL